LTAYNKNHEATELPDSRNRFGTKNNKLFTSLLEIESTPNLPAGVRPPTHRRRAEPLQRYLLPSVGYLLERQDSSNKLSVWDSDADHQKSY
jgi:hypothetical protein